MWRCRWGPIAFSGLIEAPSIVRLAYLISTRIVNGHGAAGQWRLHSNRCKNRLTVLRCLSIDFLSMIERFLVPLAGTPETLAEWLRNHISRWRKLVQNIGIVPE